MMLNLVKEKYFQMLMNRNSSIKASIDRYKNRKQRKLGEGDMNSKIISEQQNNVKSIDKFNLTNSGHVSDNDSYFDYKSDRTVKDIEITLHRYIDPKGKTSKLLNFHKIDKISHKIDFDEEMNK